MKKNPRYNISEIPEIKSEKKVRVKLVEGYERLE